MTERFKNNMLQTILSTILFVGTGIVLLAPQVPLIRKVSEYSVHIMLGMLLFSLFSMVIGKTKVMFAGLACTAALCIFLKNASHSTLKLTEANTETKLNVAHINLGNINTSGFDAVEQMLEERNIDVVSFQELTLEWKFIESELKDRFPYSISEVRIDPYGMAIFSRTPFIESDTFLCEDIPNMHVKVEKVDSRFQIISSYLIPALDNQGLRKASKQLNAIAQKVNNSNIPLIALGEYNMVYWTNEIRNFRSKTKLQNSRRDLVDSNLRVPYDHIFFSNTLECIEFEEMKDDSQNYIGIMGTYQIKMEKDYHTLNSQLSLNY